MSKEIKSIMKKTAKIAGVTCLALGGAALIASGTALKAMTLGARYLKDTIQEIIDEDPGADAAVDEAPTEEAAEAPASEAVEEEADIVEPESHKCGQFE